MLATKNQEWMKHRNDIAVVDAEDYFLQKLSVHHLSQNPSSAASARLIEASLITAQIPLVAIESYENTRQILTISCCGFVNEKILGLALALALPRNGTRNIIFS